MAVCEHCGTEFTARDSGERFCCRGCEYVHDLIQEQGFDRFYDLKHGLVVPPVRSRPFEEHDFSWLAPVQQEAEATAAARGSHAHADFSLEGISCVGCVWLIEKLFLRHPGAVRAQAHPATGRLHLEWQPGACDLTEALREFAGFGYVAAPATAATTDHERRRLAGRTGLCGAFALNAMGFSLPIYLGMPADFAFAGLFRLVAFLSATLAMLVGGSYFIDRAWRTLRVGVLHVDLPIALGLSCAYAGSVAGWALGQSRLLYLDFVATFVFLMLAGRLLQTAAVDRNRRRLVRRQPVPKTLEPAEGDTPLDLADLRPGVAFRLRCGQALPVAAVLGSAEAEFSLEWINGEADPVRVPAGRRLPAGAILLSRDPAWVRADESWSDSLLADLTAPFAEERRHPFLDRLLRVYLLVVLAAGLTGLAAWWWAGQPLAGLQVMISVFVVSCPCALGVAIPLADELAAARAQRDGVFVRSSTLWPRLRRVRTVVFDKTGTLTLERPELENPRAVGALDEAAARALALLTAGSLHPVARTLLEALGLRGQRWLRGEAVPVPAEHPGRGVLLELPDGRWTLGRPGWDGRSEPPAGGGSATELRRDGSLIAGFHFHEALRPAAPAALEALRVRGFRLFILSGDHAGKVARVAAALGIPAERAHGGLTPGDKERMVRALDRRDTLYLGDGANDSLAFNAAFVTGTPVVDRSLLESKADFFTLGSGLAFLPRLLVTAATRARGVRAAFAFAVCYNLGTVSLALAGRMHPLLAAILMPLSSILSIGLVAFPQWWRKQASEGVESSADIP